MATYYGQSSERKVEVETVPLGFEEAEWFNQFLGSQYVFKTIPPDDDKSVLLSDIDSEISDSSKDQVVIKFRWKFARPYVWKIFDNHRRRFTDKFNETFESGNPAVPSGYAGVPSFAFQEPLQVWLMSSLGQRETLPYYPYYIYSHPTTLYISMTSIHISTARRSLQAPEPVNLKCWTKSGAIMELNNAIPLRYNFYEGTQQFKILASRQIRTIRLNLIFELNGTEVFL